MKYCTPLMTMIVVAVEPTLQFIGIEQYQINIARGGGIDCNEIKRCVASGEKYRKIANSIRVSPPPPYRHNLSPKRTCAFMTTSERGYDILRLRPLPLPPSPLCHPSQFPVSPSAPNSSRLKRHPHIRMSHSNDALCVCS